jgi:hypothetical protein
MLSQRWRPLVFIFVAVLAIWVTALVGYQLARNAKMTAAKLQVYVNSVDLSKLSGEQRQKALRTLASKLNALSLEERRKARIQRSALKWFEQMTEDEKSEFVEATLPTGFKQMLASFEQLPQDQRRKTIDDALRDLKTAGEQTPEGIVGGSNDTNAPALSPEMEAKMRTIGLKAFYSQSSAQTKAELAPVIEELQRLMESGRPFRRR